VTSDRKAAGRAASERRQSDRARAYLALSRLTATIRAADFIEVLADVATINARSAVARGFGRGDRDEWRRLTEALHGSPDSNPDRE